MAPILVGVYLLVKAIQERGTGAPAADTVAEEPPSDSSYTDSSALG